MLFRSVIATNNANSATDLANTATNNANTATSGANSAKDRANTAADRAITATTNANTATIGANTAAEAANSIVGSVNSSLAEINVKVTKNTGDIDETQKDLDAYKISNTTSWSAQEKVNSSISALVNTNTSDIATKHSAAIQHTDDAIESLVGIATEDLDSIWELAHVVSGNQDVIKVLNSAITNKSDKTHTHQYLPLSGGAISGSLTMDNASLIIKDDTYNPTGGTHERRILNLVRKDGSRYGSLSSLGSKTDLQFLYLGTGSHNTNDNLKIYADGTTASNGHIKYGSSDNYFLLGGGGHVARSAYLPTSGGTLTGTLTVPSIYTSNWFRSTGTTGWFNESYGGGIYMYDTTWVRVYNGKAFLVSNTIQATGFVRGSDIRLKENIISISDETLSKVEKLRPVEYNLKSTGEKSIGFIAQEVELLYPSTVNTDDDGMKSLDYDQLQNIQIAYLMKTVAEMQVVIKQQGALIELLNNK